MREFEFTSTGQFLCYHSEWNSRISNESVIRVQSEGWRWWWSRWVRWSCRDGWVHGRVKGEWKWRNIMGMSEGINEQRKRRKGQWSRMKDKDRQIDNDIEKCEKTENVCHRRGWTLFILLSVCIGSYLTTTRRDVVILRVFYCHDVWDTCMYENTLMWCIMFCVSSASSQMKNQWIIEWHI